jgi:hypothetical protein
MVAIARTVTYLTTSFSKGNKDLFHTDFELGRLYFSYLLKLPEIHVCVSSFTM